MTFLDCTADLVGQLNGNGQKRMLQIDTPPVDSGYAAVVPWTSDNVMFVVVTIIVVDCAERSK